MYEFQPTHKISGFQRRSESIEVMLVEEGVAYTKGDWDACSTPDFEVHEGEWLFQGYPFDGEVERTDWGI